MKLFRKLLVAGLVAMPTVAALATDTAPDLSTGATVKDGIITSINTFVTWTWSVGSAAIVVWLAIKAFKIIRRAFSGGGA